MLSFSTRVAFARSAQRRGGFSLFELAIVSIILSVLVVVLSKRLLLYEEMAEKAEVDYTVSVLKSQLRLNMASMLTAGRAQEFGTLANSNPVEWLTQKPAHYIGNVDSRSAVSIPLGSWYFNTDQHVLVYRLRHSAYFSGVKRAHAEIRFQVVRIPGTPRSDNALLTYGDTVAIKSIESYKWL